MSLAVKKKCLMALVFIFSIQPMQVRGLDRSFLKRSLVTSAAVVGAVGAVGLGVWACTKINDYHERAHLQELEQAVAVLYAQLGESEHVANHIRSLQEQAGSYLVYLNAMKQAQGDTVVRLPIMPSLLAVPQFDGEQNYLQNVLKKWKDSDGYQEYYYRAVAVKAQLDRICFQTDLSAVIGIHNKFVSFYEKLVSVIMCHHAVITWFKQGILTVSHESFKRRFMYLSYKRTITDDIEQLEAIMSKTIGICNYDIIYQTASVWQRALKDYLAVLVVSDQYRLDSFNYDRYMRDQAKGSGSWESKHVGVSGQFSPKTWDKGIDDL